MSSKQDEGVKRVELHIILDVEDGWPPVALEGLPCTVVATGYRVEMPPLFVKNLSAGDVISVVLDGKENVISWTHVSQSARTTIWLLRMAQSDDIDAVLTELRKMNCNTVRLPEYGCYSIDVPAECAIQNVDACLKRLDSSRVAIAYPSFRHTDE